MRFISPQLLLSLLLLVALTSTAQKTDYREYHKGVNHAEELFFLEGNVDSSLISYNKVFSDFDFLFVKDLINAAQIAIYSKKPYVQYLEEGFAQGLKVSHLSNYPLFNAIYDSLRQDQRLVATYDSARKEYIQRIDYMYLDYVYKRAIKNFNARYDSKTYRAVNKEISKDLMETAKTRGFPGDRIIGISDSTAFKEIGSPQLDLHNQRKNNRMISKDGVLAARLPINVLFDTPCAYFLNKDIWMDQIIKGNIHPREVAFLHDHTYSFLKAPCKGLLKGVYRLNNYTNYSNIDKRGIDTNSMRAQLYIVSTEVDDRKKEYENLYGFKLFSGYYSCR